MFTKLFKSWVEIAPKYLPVAKPLAMTKTANKLPVLEQEIKEKIFKRKN